jgi:hypothetical protein
MPHFATWLAIRRELFAVTLDPWTQTEIQRGYLAPGTLIENACAILAEAERVGRPAVIVHTRDGAGWTGTERVATASLRHALA